MSTLFLRAPFRGFLMLATVIAFFGFMPPAAHAQLFTETSAVHIPPGAGFNYGSWLTVSGGSILVGDQQTSTGGQPNQRNVFEFTRGASGWTLAQTFQAPNFGAFASDATRFLAGDTVYTRVGNSWQGEVVFLGVANAWSAAVQGNTIAYGIPIGDGTQSDWLNGVVQVYEGSGATWNSQSLTLPPAGRNEALGADVALDGNTLLASTYNRSPGAVYVFTRSGGTWSLQGALNIPDPGKDLRLALEGDTAAVSDTDKKCVWIFTRSGTTWNLTQTLTYEPVGGDSIYIIKVALKDGVLAVGGIYHRVYFYTKTSTGWTQAQTIPGPFQVAMDLFDGGKAFAIYQSSVGDVQISSVPPAPIPGSGWRDYDIGAVGVAGSSGDDGTTVTVRGSGTDIWERGDQFHFRAESLTGDGAIIARVTSAGSAHPWAKAGLMFREDVAPSSREVMTLLASGGPLGTQVRTSTADNTAFQDAGWAGAPMWLMLARSGDLFASYRSEDGDHWTPIGSATVKMPATIHVGLAVSSHDNPVLNTGTFTNVELVGLPPPANNPPAAPASLQAGNQTSTTVALSWTDNSNDETGFEVQRSPGDGSDAFTVVTTTVANATSYADSGLTPDTQYTYRVRAVRSGTFSANSNTFTVRTLAGNDTNPGWTSADIGNVGLAGSTSASGNAVTLNAAGEDIWNQADGFRFYYRPWSGDGSVTARVTALTNTYPWAKAGVMIRESLDPAAANAAMVLTADNVCGFQTRPTTGAATDFASGSWVNAVYWVRITRSGNVFSGYVSPDGANWTLVGSRTMALSANVYVGLVASSHNTAAQTMASFDNVMLPDAPPPPPPPASSDWTQQLWGSASGSVTSSSNTVSVTATGDDIWNNSDAGCYAWKTWSGDGEFVTRVDSFNAAHPWAKAGIMFRAGSGANAMNAFVAITAGVGAVFQFRGGAGQSSIMATQDWTPGPGSWLRLRRLDNDFFAYYSVNEGMSWMPLGRQYIAMPADIQVGFAVSSHDSNAAATVRFSNFSASPTTPSNLRVTHLGPSGEVDLAWNDNSTDETGFVIEQYRLNDGRDAAFAARMTVPAGATTAVLLMPQGEFFQFRVKAIGGTLASGYSNTTSAETTIGPALSVRGRTSTSISLHWEARENNVGGAYIDGPYSLERCTDGVSFVEIAGNVRARGSDYIYTDTGLTPGTGYYYRVRYLDEKGNTSGYGTLPAAVQTSL